jgi:hypothetical protein
MTLGAGAHDTAGPLLRRLTKQDDRGADPSAPTQYRAVAVWI